MDIRDQGHVDPPLKKPFLDFSKGARVPGGRGRDSHDLASRLGQTLGLADRRLHVQGVGAWSWIGSESDSASQIPTFPTITTRVSRRR